MLLKIRNWLVHTNKAKDFYKKIGFKDNNNSSHVSGFQMNVYILYFKM